MVDAPTVPPRHPEGHKGTFGTVLVVGGAVVPRIMPGGPALAARAAIRSGCGLATLAVPEPLAIAGATITPEATLVPLEIDSRVGDSAGAAIRAVAAEAHAVVVGPGLGRPVGIEGFVESIVDLEDRPRVVDADALNALAEGRRDRLRGPIILTPHPGEWSRLARAVGVEQDPLHDAGRPAAAAALARRLDAGGGPVVVVLKGARTIVADGERWWRCDRPNPALATAGSGDVLAGVIGGLLAQFHPRPGARPLDWTRDAFEIARIGVALHAAAGTVWSDRHGDAGMLASDLADAVPAGRRLLQSGNA
jgi:NAD(P)H-hydrate epimerase